MADIFSSALTISGNNNGSFGGAEKWKPSFKIS